MLKYTKEQRLEVVLKVTEEYLSYRDIAKLLGCGKSTVQRWLRRYEQFGDEGLSLKHGTYTAYTGKFKQHVIEYMHKNSLSISETAVKFGIPADSTVHAWERIYNKEGPQALYRDNRGRKKKMTSKKPKKVKPGKKVKEEEKEDLIAEIQRLRMENAYLKKLNALVQERIARENGKRQPPSTN